MELTGKMTQLPDMPCPDWSRREFLKWSAALGGLAALDSGGLSLGLRLAEAAEKAGTADEVMTWACCVVNCGSLCPLRLFTKDGRLVRVEPDNTGDGPGQREIRACLRGRSVRQLTYSPDRVKYPMKRIGKRGEGKFQRISWDEALDTIAKELRRIIDTYGNEAVYRQYGSGTTSASINRRNEFYRLINLLGGYMDQYGTYSSAQISAATPYTYGQRGANTVSDMVNSRLVVLFGNNPIETRASGGGISYDLMEARRKGKARFIIIDPRYSDTAALVADEWVPIRPGTDAALASAIAHVLITEDLVDQPFLDKYCVGYDESTMPEDIPPGNSYKDYILGTGSDGLAKTPAWAAPITGYPADGIVRLAREIGMAKPCFIVQGLGPQRHACGEQSARAILTLASLTGNVGINGGNTGDQEGSWGIQFPKLPTGKNPVKTLISFYTWDRAIADPKSMTALNAGVRNKDKLDVGIKFMWNSCSNATINQHSDINATKKILEDEKACEMIVVVETRMTPTAMFADILLPSTTPAEDEDIYRQGSAMEIGYLLISPRAIKPLFEARTQYDICTDLAKRLGVLEQYTEGRTQADWVRYLYEQARKMKPELPEDFNEATKIGLFKWMPGKPKVALKAFRDDPVANPLKTPSGKIEIFSKRLWDMSKTWELPEGDVLKALPEYVTTWECYEDPLRKKLPLQLIGHHYKGRVHSSYCDLPWLVSVAPQRLWINPVDAQARGLNHGDQVKVFNDRGATLVKIKVTPRIMPGVVSLPQGAWYKPNAQGVDTEGSVNILTRTHLSPLAKGNPQHTNLVEVVKA
ncbi:MAG: molybdopterin-dependent oxidoreductase [Desulfovibrio sp.]|jgi:DmsA/YnfE family anaerobic dimethyl sulfoxide reductase A subunit|nr:molybdopterin-dependent oxidoreductase [Desulfovibrio sp.]